MADASRSIGAATARFSRFIERARLLAFRDALGLRHPIHGDTASARAAGYRDIVAPPGFVIAMTVVPRHLKLSSFGIDERRALAGGMGFEHHAPICAGDTLSGRCVLTSIREKSGLTILGFETRLTNQFGQLVLVVSDTVLERA